MMPNISGILGSFSQTNIPQDTNGYGEDEGKKSSPDQFYNAASTFSPSPDMAEAMENLSDSDSEPICDRTQSIRALRLKPVNVETQESSDHNLYEPRAETPNYPDEEDELATFSNTLLSPCSTQESLECFTQSPFRNTSMSVPLKSTLIYPKSQYDGYIRPLPICSEHIAVRELRRAAEDEDQFQTMSNKSISEGEEFEEFELTDFAMYLPKNAQYAFELRGLQDFASKAGYSTMLLDGVLRAGTHRRYVQGVPFEVCSIGNYGKEHHTVGGEIWIQSSYNKRSSLYYRLKAPSQEYRRFHTEFLWLADLAKHFFDYCEACEEEGKPVSVHNFRNDFSRCLLDWHKDSAEFCSWYQMYPGNDFRRTVSANILFLFKESIGVKDQLRKQPIWSELLEKNFIPTQPIQQDQTVVTPYVYDCFAHLHFGPYLKAVEPAVNAQYQQAIQGNSLHLTATQSSSCQVIETASSQCSQTRTVRSVSPTQTTANASTARGYDHEWRNKTRAIRVGDVISVFKDEENSVWKDEVSRWKLSDHCWYVYVQAVHKLDGSNERAFDGIWLYKPSDTSCAKMKYPYTNELFLSDNCTCEDGKMIGTIEEDAVIGIVPVTWNGQPSGSTEEFFIRQTYLENERFVSLKESHKRCDHYQSEKFSGNEGVCGYSVGQTVLVAQRKLSPPRRKSKYDLDPYEIIKYEVSNSKQYAILRRLLRRHEIKGQLSCKANELVYCDEMFKVETRKIERTCLVRFYSEADVANNTIPAPYNRDGTGNAFFITSKLVGDEFNGELSPLGVKPHSLIEGFDPTEKVSRPKLRGLDLYCGGGNFGRGLEEGQAVHNNWAVDMDKIAIHTYYANLLDPQDSNLYSGSVNDQLFQALMGNPEDSKLIPLPGEVDFISAGSPCQGFSLLNSSREAEKGLKNQSMVASVVAYIDFYRPKYGLLENVLSMAQKGKARDHDVLSQLICAIVGMGYQLSTFLIDAWSYGSPQSRSRIFVAFTAPDYEPIPHPEKSHSHPPGVGERGLGLQANGEAFGKRVHEPTPLNYVTAGAAVDDLPYLGDGSTHTCVLYPDHVLHNGVSKETRLRIAAIPKFPRGMNFWTAWNDGKGVMTKEQRALFPSSINSLGKAKENVGKTSKAWGRVNPNNLFGTVVVATSAHDARTGTVLHWDQNRCLTVMEGRRAQSFPDDEIIVGTEHQRMKIIGNSVDRSVSLALGLALRKAWEKNSWDECNLNPNVVVDHTPLLSTHSAIYGRDKHQRFSTSPESSNSSSFLSAQNTSSNELTGRFVFEDISGALAEPLESQYGVQKNRLERFASKIVHAPENRHSEALVRSEARDTLDRTLARCHHRDITEEVGETKSRLSSLLPKASSGSQSYLLTIRDLYDSDDGILDLDCRRQVNQSASQNIASLGRAKDLQSMKTAPLHANPTSQTSSTKRRYAGSVPQLESSEKVNKVAKVSDTSSPLSFSLRAHNKSTTRTVAISRPHLSTSNPVNASHLSEKLQGVLKQRIADRSNAIAEETDSEETDFNGFSSSSDEDYEVYDDEEEEDDDDDDDDDDQAINMDLDTLNLSLKKPWPTESLRQSSQISNSKPPWIVNTSQRGSGKSPMEVRPKNQFFIDLTSDAEDEIVKGVSQPTAASLPVRPAFVMPRKKYSPAGSNPFLPYAQTYRANNMDRARKHGPKR